MPDPHGLPTIEVLLDETRASSQISPDDDVEEIDLTAIEAAVSPSPARAEPHDAAAWLPLPHDVDDLPSVHALLDPHPEHQAAIVAEAEAVAADYLAVVEASSAPSPARAEPHDAATWLPLPTLEELPAVTDLLEEGPPAGTVPRRRRRHRFLPAPRVLGVAVMVVLTALGGAWIVQQATAPSGSDVTFVVDGTRQQVHTDADSVGALLTAAGVRLAPGDVVVPSSKSALHDGIHVDVLRAFPVTVDVDGNVRTVRTVETSADRLARHLKLNKLTAVRNNPGRLAAGASVVYRTRVAGSLTIDNQKVTFDSPSRTVDELLQAYNVKLGRRRLRDAVDRQRAARRRRRRRGARRGRDLADHPGHRVRHRGAGRPDAPDRPDPHPPGRQRRHHDRHVPPGRRERSEGREAGRVGGPDDRADAEDHRHRQLRQPEVGRARGVRVGRPMGHRRQRSRRLRRRPRHLPRTWRAFGGAEFAPNAGLATREQQIIVGMRIYRSSAGPVGLREQRRSTGRNGACDRTLIHGDRPSPTL